MELYRFDEMITDKELEELMKDLELYSFEDMIIDKELEEFCDTWGIEEWD